MTDAPGGVGLRSIANTLRPRVVCMGAVHGIWLARARLLLHAPQHVPETGEKAFHDLQERERPSA
jgi:hypothetical protein